MGIINKEKYSEFVFKNKNYIYEKEDNIFYYLMMIFGVIS